MTTTEAPRRDRLRLGQTELVLGVVLLALVSQRWLVPALDDEALGTWATMFVAIVVQAVPFLVFGVLLAAVISHLVTDRALERVVPDRAALGVPAAGLAGVALPGCECASVPVSASLIRRGVVPAVALTFMLAAPAVNPVVIVATAVAFPDQPLLVLARFLASLLTAVLIGWLWLWRGGRVPMRLPRGGGEHGGSFLGSVQHDFLHAAGFLVLGAALAAVVNTFVSREVLDSVAGQAVAGIVAMALFAFVVAMCSEADAFVAASLTAFSDTAKLVFMVVGPAMDIKLASMQAGTFGRGFALVFVPLVVVVATGSAVLVGGWLL
ncbi:permease [Nocardioides sp. CFH 31398]|uniref:permease n=1 Tax=Nocardioides sp. CFH 31398 TaxID=2919579 RepID=UPI001F06DF52|nr:permease [Nocardioides sp. CFH 31398]MCH1867876.1 permease [Nocardioides sp. CFH 31398]